MSTIGLEPQTSRAGRAAGKTRWAWPLLPALAYTALAVYGSLVPFDFHPRPLADAWARFLALRGAPVGIQSRADWAANVLLFVPLAYLWSAAVWPRRPWARAGAGLAVWALAVVLSAAIEFTQSFLPSRSVSLNDILAEGLGAALGVAAYSVTGARLAAWLQSWRTERTVPGLAGPALILYLAGLALFGLMPFDLSLSPALVYEKVVSGRVRLGPVPRLDGSQALTDVLTDVALWIPAGFLGWLAVPPAPRRHPTWRSATLVWLGGVVAAGGIEAAQLLVYSRVVDASDVTLAALGAALGVWLAQRAFQSSRPSPAARAVHSESGPSPDAMPAPPAIGRSAWLGAIGFAAWLAVVIVVLWQPFDFTADRAFLSERARRLSLVPFRAFYFSSELRAVTELVRKTLLFMPLGVAAALVARAAPARWRWAAGAAALTAIAGLAAVIEVGKIFLPSRSFDPGNVLLEVAAAAVGYWLVLAAGDRLRQSSRQPELG
jgi:VanZ family protein